MMMKISCSNSYSRTKSVMQYLAVSLAVSLSGLALILVPTLVPFVSNPFTSHFQDKLLVMDQYSTSFRDNDTSSREEIIIEDHSMIYGGYKPQLNADLSIYSTTKELEVMSLKSLSSVGDLASSNLTLDDDFSPSLSNDIVSSRICDLYHGKWMHDKKGPLYTNHSCPIITRKQNCQGNGRPDKDYENWKWQPEHCDLPRFDARKFLRLMRGKTLAFVGDSVARNHMESLVCALWQVEVPKTRGSHRMQRWRFRSTSTTIARIWSSWLVNKTTETLQSVPDDVVKVHLDIADENLMMFLPTFDVVVISTGHWFTKQSAYFRKGTLVGAQIWRPENSTNMHINNTEAFSIALETSLTAIASHPNFTGLTVFRTYSPDHYKRGTWNFGESCTHNLRPTTEPVRNEYTKLMHEKQINGFKKAQKSINNSSKFILMDITESFGYRPDGHPGPYTSIDAKNITQIAKRQPPRQDCLHWCMPGPIDTWNEILLEIIQREFEYKETLTSSIQ